MTTVFIVCATIGGTVLIIQFLLTLVGLGGHAFDIDVPHDIAHDLGVDLHVDAGGDFHVDANLDADHDVAAIHHGSSWLFGVLSFRTITAALAFFGLCGLAAHSAEMSTMYVTLIATAGGAGAMTAVYWMMRGLRRLDTEGTVRIQRAVGRHGCVYLGIPGEDGGSGKIQINLQNRTMEYSAVTSGPRLPTGTKVVVVGVVNPNTVEVVRDE
jgi:membrane protein implicated in regulation of membrane protease activity